MNWKVYLFIITIILIVFYLKIKKAIDNLKYDFDINKINLNGDYLIVDLCIFIWLKYLFNINLKDVKIKIYYKNKLIGENYGIKEANIINNSKSIICDKIKLIVNKESGELIGKISSGSYYEFDYEVTSKIFGIKINFKNKYKNENK